MGELDRLTGSGQVTGVARGPRHALPPRRGAQARQLWALLRSWRWGIPVSVIRGPAVLTGQPSAVVLAGSELPTEHLLSRILRHPRQRQPISRVAAWRLLRTLEELRQPTDLVLAHIDTMSARLLCRAGWLRVPGLVDMWMIASMDEKDLVRGSHSLEQDLRLVRKNRFAWQVSDTADDVVLLFRSFYLPSIRNRHGPEAFYLDLGLLRSCYARGGLGWVTQDGRRVAGMLFDRQRRVMRVVASGTESGRWDLVRGGATSAGYYFAWKHALELGCTHINFGGCHAQLTDGLLRYKRKWGMSLAERPDTYYDTLVSWETGGPIALAFLRTAPIVHHGRAMLSALAVVDGDGRGTADNAKEAHRSVWTPGLQELRLVCPSGWQAGAAGPTQTRLLNWDEAGGGDPRRLLR